MTRRRGRGEKRREKTKENKGRVGAGQEEEGEEMGEEEGWRGEEEGKEAGGGRRGLLALQGLAKCLIHISLDPHGNPVPHFSDVKRKAREVI